MDFELREEQKDIQENKEIPAEEQKQIQETKDKLEEVLKRPKIKSVIGWDNNRIKRYLAGLEEASILVEHPPILEIVKEDPTDDHILACAVAARVDYLITGDNHLMQLGNYKGIQIVSPSEFLIILQK